MRLRLPLCAVALILTCAFPAVGQEKSFEASVFVEPGGSYSEDDGLDLDTGLGVGAGFGWRFAPHWTAEARFTLYDPESGDAESYQLGLRYAFGDTDARWRPFVAGGVHLGQRELRREVVCVAGPCPDLEQSFDETGLFLGGGVDWQLNGWFALRFEGRLLIYDSELYDDIEEDIDVLAGAVFRF